MFVDYVMFENYVMSELVTSCHAVATALDAAADVIVGTKGVAIAELTALAASFVADQAGAVATPDSRRPPRR